MFFENCKSIGICQGHPVARKLSHKQLRKPFFKGAWVGLNFSHNKAYLYRAILESIAYIKYNEYMNIKKFLKIKSEEITNILLIGGGARSNLWAQIF